MERLRGPFVNDLKTLLSHKPDFLCFTSSNISKNLTMSFRPIRIAGTSQANTDKLQLTRSRCVRLRI
jgi:hypothetical protein